MATEMARQLSSCGTEAAYRRHRRNREIACEACRKAHATYEAERYWARKVVQAA